MSNKLCRLCLEKYSDRMDIFSVNCEEKHLQIMVYSLFSFWIKPTDISTAICWQCIGLVKDFYKFYRRVKKAQISLSRDSFIKNVNPLDNSQDDHPNILIEDYMKEIQNYSDKDVPKELNEDNITFKELKNIIKEEQFLENQETAELEISPNSPQKDFVLASDFGCDAEYFKVKSDVDDYDDDFQKNSDDEKLDPSEYQLDSDDNLLAYSRKTILLNRKQEKKKKKSKKSSKLGGKKHRYSEEKHGEMHIDQFKSDFSGIFPTEIIKNGRLNIKGSVLDKLISKFYSLRCELCEISPELRNLTTLMKHFNSEHGTKGYLVCCNTRLYHHRTIYMHMARHLQPSAFECPICKKEVSRPYSLKLHLQTHLPESEKPHKCDLCDRRFAYMEGLTTHKITHIPADERKTYDCEVCGKIFTLRTSFAAHMKEVHTNPNYLCSECGRKFHRKTELTVHMLTHDTTGINKVQCSQCGFMCKNQPTLKVHMKRHTAERLRCTVCDYTTHRQPQLKLHMRVKHSDEKPFVCVVCGKQFKLKSVLRVHMAQHTGEHKFHCPFCPKTFASPGNSFSHRKRMHADEYKNDLDMKQKKQYKSIDSAVSKSEEVDETQVHELARECLKKITEQNSYKRAEIKSS